ncbi:MAG: GAF domain-containing protein [Pseudomonadota bacterium]
MTSNTTMTEARDLLESGRQITEGAVPEPIANSWHRCRQMGLDPRGVPTDAVVTDGELRTLLEVKEQLMQFVRPELELLSSQIAGTNFLCAFGDENGVVLEAITDAEFDASACARSVRVGSVWREEVRGTNALGLALSTRQTSMVTGQEHFFVCHGGVSCVSAPIFASDGAIVGLLDASSEVEERQLHTRALVKLAATNIENRLFVETHQSDYIVQFHPRAEYLTTQSVGLIAFTPAGRIAGANRNSSRLLSGLGFAEAGKFGDLFRGDFHVVLRKLIAGETVKLCEWLNSGFFARLHPGSPIPAEHTVAQGARLAQPGLSRIAPRDGQLVLDDEMVRDALRVAVKAARLGQPVCIRGAAGTGKLALAEAVHCQAYPGTPLVVLDCRRLSQAAGDPEASGVPLGRAEPFDALLGDGGTLIVKNLAEMDGRGAEQIGRLLDGFRDVLTSRRGSVLATQTVRPGEIGERILARAGLQLLAVDLPSLEVRTDFDKLARSLLADLSSDHQLSTRALRTLTNMVRPNNIKDLQHHLQVLVASFPSGVLRESQVHHLFPQCQGRLTACPRCKTSPIRQKRCLEIRKMFRACQGNVALTARRLGLSRNTVYAHLKD